MRSPPVACAVGYHAGSSGFPLRESGTLRISLFDVWHGETLFDEAPGFFLAAEFGVGDAEFDRVHEALGICPYGFFKTFRSVFVRGLRKFPKSIPSPIARRIGSRDPRIPGASDPGCIQRDH